MHRRRGCRPSRSTQEWEVLLNREGRKEEWLLYYIHLRATQAERNLLSGPIKKEKEKKKKSTAYKKDQEIQKTNRQLSKMYQLLQVRNLYKLYIKN